VNWHEPVSMLEAGPQCHILTPGQVVGKLPASNVKNESGLYGRSFLRWYQDIQYHNQSTWPPFNSAALVGKGKVSRIFGFVEPLPLIAD